MTPRRKRGRLPLDPRLRAVADAVRAGAVAADVGTDHGYLICELVASGRCPRGYAADIGVQPLEAARGHIRERGLDDRIETMLCDGLRGLPGDKIDDVAVAGMGGELIASILSGVDWTRDPDKRYILQPMTRADHLRRALYQEGFALLEETAAVSGRFVYTVMTARWTGAAADIDERFAHTGLLWEKADRISRLYLRRVMDRLKRQAEGLLQSRDERDKGARFRELALKIAEHLDRMERMG